MMTRLESNSAEAAFAAAKAAENTGVGGYLDGKINEILAEVQRVTQQSEDGGNKETLAEILRLREEIKPKLLGKKKRFRNRELFLELLRDCGRPLLGLLRPLGDLDGVLERLRKLLRPEDERDRILPGL